MLGTFGASGAGSCHGGRVSRQRIAVHWSRQASSKAESKVAIAMQPSVRQLASSELASVELFRVESAA